MSSTDENPTSTNTTTKEEEDAKEKSVTASSSSSSSSLYEPPEVWTYEETSGSIFTMNRPTAGARFEKILPRGKHPIQLYSVASPNGQKVTILLEELIERGIDIEYDAWHMNLMKDHDQFGSDFVSINPNSKIPAMRIYDTDNDDNPLNLFESGSMLLQLAETYNAFIPTDPRQRSQTLNWLFWQMASTPYLGGGFGHFYAYATEKNKYAIDRFTMETKRQLDVLNQHLATRKYIVDDDYTIADIAIYPWYGNLVLHKLYAGSGKFLNVDNDYPHVIRWATEIDNRPAVQRGKIVNKTFGDGIHMPERHSKQDFDAVLNQQQQQS